jgi:glycosyltransferase involved in cell wall biosynthesis
MLANEKNDFILGIDASNIIIGGGITHLNELLSHFPQKQFQFKKIIVWGPKLTLDQLPNRVWLAKKTSWFLNKNLLIRFIWQIFILGLVAKREKCNILFSPGGINLCYFSPVVTMSQNLLPFDWYEIRQFGFSIRGLKFVLLRVLQVISFRHSQGIIFLTNFAYKAVLDVVGNLHARIKIIEHGVPQSMISPAKICLPIEAYDDNNKFKLLYVSSVDAYKHQLNVLLAVFKLRQKGYHLSIDFVGSGHKKYQNKLIESMKSMDPHQHWSCYKNAIPYSEMYLEYQNADMAVFASSCETFGIVLLEKMIAGLPIVCSKQSSMSETLQEAAIYFDCREINSIVLAIERLILDPQLREEMSKDGFKIASEYTWEKSALKTFRFLEDIANEGPKK